MCRLENAIPQRELPINLRATRSWALLLACLGLTAVLFTGGPASGPVAAQTPNARVLVSTPRDVVERMLRLANVQKQDVVFDLGSGDGRIVIAAAKQYGCKAVGYELDLLLVKLSRENIKINQLQHLAKIEQKDVLTLDLSGASVITVYLPPNLMEKLIPQFKKLEPGTRIVSHEHQIPGAKPNDVIVVPSKHDGKPHALFLWITPLKIDRHEN